MKKITVLFFAAAVLAALSACNAGERTYSEEEYNNIVSERNKLAGELDVIKNSSVHALKNDDPANVRVTEAQIPPPETAPSKETEPEPEKPSEPAVIAGEVETERKFLVDSENLPWDLMNYSTIYDFVQTYICYSPEMRVRAISGHKNYYAMTIKTPLDDTGLSRQEIEFVISESEYEELLKKQVGTTINKKRYQFWANDRYTSVDIYSGELEGLIVAEVEFESVVDSESYQPPEWFAEEVTSDDRYKNVSLAKDGMPE